MTTAIIIIGNPVDGMEYVGPFPSRDDAIDHANSPASEHWSDSGDWWVADLTTPDCPATVDYPWSH